MEINRDEAELEFKIAQHRLRKEDYTAARESALRAQKLFPELEGLDQLLQIINVLVHCNTGPDGKSEWYGVLGVDPSDSRQVIRKSYCRLSLMLHPDKQNAMFGKGEEAMRLVLEAWGVLSEQESRAEYDIKLKKMHEEIEEDIQKKMQEDIRKKMQVSTFYDFFKESAADGTSSVPFASSSFKEEVKKNDADKGNSVPFESSHFEDVFKNGAVKPQKPPIEATSPRSAPKWQTQQGSSSQSKFDQMFDQTAANLETTPAAATTTSPKPQTQQGSCSLSSPKPRGRKAASGSTPNPQPRKYTKRSNFENARPARRESFWTVCTNCKMRYEYDRIFLNAKLTCPAADCKKLFPAIAIPPPKKIYKRKQSPSHQTPKSTKSTTPQDASGSEPVFKVPRPCTPPILATPVSSVPFYATSCARPLIINPITEIPMEARENLEETFSGPVVSDENDLDSESSAARKAGKSVVIEEPSVKKWYSSF